MWGTIANFKENLNKIALDVHYAHDDDDDDDDNDQHHVVSPAVSDRRNSHTFAHSNSFPSSPPPNGMSDHPYASEIEQYKAEIKRLQASEAEIKALSVNYAAILKEKEDFSLSMASSSSTNTNVGGSSSDPSIYTNYVNVHLSIDKLDGTNYATWASGIKLWLKSQGYVDHLTKNVTIATTDDTSRWMKIDAQLCIVIKSTIHSSLKQMFRSYETCSKVWAQAKLFYTNDTQRLYGVCQDLFTVIGPRSPGTMVEYLDKVHALLHDFNELLPPASTPAEELEQRSKFFMLLALYGLSDDFSHVRDQILGSPVIPNFTSTCSTLLRIPSKPVTETSPHSDDSSVMVVQHDDRSRSCKPRKGRPKCDYCGKLGHKIDRCYALHGRPPRPIAMANSDPPPRSSSADHPTSSNTVENPAIFHEFLKWHEDRQHSSSTTFASVARTGLEFGTRD